MAKVVIVESAVRDEMVKQISKYANTQNPMQQADLSANEPFHVAVERLSRSTWCPGGERRWFEGPNCRSLTDFVHDQLADRRRFSDLSIIDDVP